MNKRKHKASLSYFPMSIIKHRSSLLLFFQFALIVVVSSASDGCSYSTCTTMVIKSPFRISDQPPTCGLPGFDLLCSRIPYGKPDLFFPSSGQTFSVDYIYYNLKEITLRDPQGCLPGKLLGFDPSGTPFHFQNQTKFPIYNCTRSDKIPMSYRYTEIACLSGLTYSVLWDKYGLLSTTYGCVFIGNAMGPGAWANYVFLVTSASSVDLTWELPSDCKRDPKDLTKLKCSSKQLSDLIKVLLGTGIPILLVGLFCFGCYKCKEGIRNSSNRAAERRSRSAVTTSTTNTQTSVLPSGLEQDTLDAYPIIVVGESGRILVNMEDRICSICLSEYEPRETLKTLPECLHKFHADCIDEWLRAKALCPICRTPPPKRAS